MLTDITRRGHAFDNKVWLAKLAQTAPRRPRAIETGRALILDHRFPRDTSFSQHPIEPALRDEAALLA